MIQNYSMSLILHRSSLTRKKMTCLFDLVFILCLSVVSSDANKTVGYVSSPETVELKPPTNLTVFMTRDSSVFLRWAAPDVYPLHKLNQSYIDFQNESDSYDWEVTTVSSEDNQNTNGSSDVTTVQPAGGKGDNSAQNNTAPAPQPDIPTCLNANEFKDLDIFEVPYPIEQPSETNTEKSPSINFDNNNTANTTTMRNIKPVRVDFNKGCVTLYSIQYYEGSSSVTVNEITNGTQTEYNLTGLKPGTEYNISVTALFASGDSLSSENITVTTLSKGNTTSPKSCRCSYFGSNTRTCDMSKFPWCQCKSGYAGVFCEVCAEGHYRSAPYFPCNRCPCAKHATTEQTCYYREGFLVCNRCKPQYTGHLCQSCVKGYYRYKGHCVPCNCNGNGDPTLPRMCDQYSGNCIKCLYNTTGANCERCLPDFLRLKANDRHCVHRASQAFFQNESSKGVIAGICIAIILVLCAIVGFVVYRRWKIFPPRKPFWTVELKENHDGVNFSAVPGQEYHQHDAATAGVEDLDFYEKYGGKPKGKSVSSYAQLKEEI